MQDLIAFRKQLHQYPELSGAEQETAQRIAAALAILQPSQLITEVGGHGVIAVFDTDKAGKTVLFRAELDALPIQEANDFAYASKRSGVSHKCGHDGHSTILLGLAQKVRTDPLQKGKVVLLFQPAEETGQGAQAVLADPKFRDLSIDFDFAFALHNVPGYPKGQIVFRKGAFNPAVISLAIQLQGLKTHAAEQENGINPDMAISQIIATLKQWHHNDPASPDFCNITTVYCTLGNLDYGTAAGEGEVHFTIRCWTTEKLKALQGKITEAIEQICTQQQLKYSLDWRHYFAATHNDETAVGYIQKAVNTLSLSSLEKPFPFKWGEDFGLFTEHCAGAMFGLGAGENTPALHQPDYDFPDDILETGIAVFYKIANSILSL